MKRISVFGLGYVGCVSAACLANTECEVIGVELNEDKVDIINRGLSPIIETGLAEMLSSAVRLGRFTATTSCEAGVSNSDMALICVGTPSSREGQLDTSALIRVSKEIGAALRGRSEPFTIVVRSTVLPGTTHELVSAAVKEACGDAGPEIRFAVNPEFLREGTAISDFFEPPFTLVGADDKQTCANVASLYQLVETNLIETNIRTAETVKYVCNAYHALKVCFANEIADVCDSLGADSQEVMRIFAEDAKLNISKAYLTPGFAFGGSCLPKDLKALTYAATHAHISTPVLSAILPSNRGQIEAATTRILEEGRRRIGIVGLSFKPGTDDLRESPMVAVVEVLVGKGFDVKILDRNVALSGLLGANRVYIEQEIPHIASLICENMNALLNHAETIVVGSTGDDCVEAVKRARLDQEVIDLTRGQLVSKLARLRRAA